jgi:hypothetical protein
MNLTITDNSNQKIQGKSLKEHLTTGLNDIEAKSPTHAAPLFQTAETDKVEIEITAGDEAQREGKKVKVGYKITQDKYNKLKSDGIKELVESTIFEIKNAVNSGRYDTEETAIKNGTKTLMAYGEAYSDIESESCLVVKQILTEAKDDYTPSEWGKKLLEKYKNDSDLNGVKSTTRTSEHVPGANDYMALYTPQLYAFEYIKKMGGAKLRTDVINKAITSIKFTPTAQLPKTITTEDVYTKMVKENLMGFDLKLGTKNSNWNTALYHFFIDILAHLSGLNVPSKGTWSVTWQGTAAGWAFTNEMKQQARKNQTDTVLVTMKQRMLAWSP